MLAGSTMHKKKFMNLILRNIFAIFLIIIGFSGLILPILPGWPLIIWGLFIIGGSALVDKKILRYLPKKTRKRALNFLQSKEKKHK